MASNSRAWRHASAVVVAATPAITGTRPAAASSVTSTTRFFCSHERYANSPVLPSGARPWTPAAMTCSQSRPRTPSMTAPSSSMGDTR